MRTLQGSSSVDVYDRRLKIYKAARSFVDLITQNAKVSKQEIGNYSREIEEALFLFDETIEAHLLELFRKAVRLHTIEMVVERADDTKRIQLIDESSNLLIWFNDQTGVIRSKMKPFLSLR